MNKDITAKLKSYNTTKATFGANEEEGEIWER